jgi:hypothetical protein
MLREVFLVLFLTGSALAVLSFVLGVGHAAIHVPHVHVPGLPHPHAGAGHGGAPTAHGGGDLSVLNASTITAFVAWFGGGGYLLDTLTSLPAAAVVLGALGTGLAGAAVVAVALVRFLLPAQTAPLRAEDFRLEGTLAVARTPLAGARTGEVTYSRGGTLRCETARSADGGEIPRGAEVVILRCERGVAYVAPLDRLLAERQQGEGALSRPGRREERT